MKYTEHLVNSFLSSNHTGTISGANVVNRVINKETGDAVKMYLVVEDGIIKNAKFQACGSVVLFASMSAIVDLILGKPVEEANSITEKQIIKEIKQVNRCDYSMVTFAVKALNTALSNYFKKLAKQNLNEAKPAKPVRIKSIVPSSLIRVYKDGEEAKEQQVEQPKEAQVEVEEDLAPVTLPSIEAVPTKIEVRIMEEEPVVHAEEVKEAPKPAKPKKEHKKVEEPQRNEDVIDEIDSITAKLTDAITKLNFKFDVDSDSDE